MDDDLKKDENIIELTDVVEEAPGPPAGRWMETTPRPVPEKKTPGPAGAKKEGFPPSPADLKGIPDSPLKKFIMAEEEPAAPAPPGEKQPGLSTPAASPLSPREGGRPGGGAPEIPRERPRTLSPEPAAPAPAAAREPEPPRRTPPAGAELDMRAVREATLARVEIWLRQEGSAALETIAREMFPAIAERIIREEIERMKAKTEEKE